MFVIVVAHTMMCLLMSCLVAGFILCTAPQSQQCSAPLQFSFAVASAGALHAPQGWPDKGLVTVEVAAAVNKWWLIRQDHGHY